MYEIGRKNPKLPIDAADEAEIDINSAVDIYQWLKEICTTKLLQAPIMFGGTSVIVQINESLFRHKPKVCIKCIM